MDSIVRGLAAIGFAGALSGIAVARLAADALPVPLGLQEASLDGFGVEYRFLELDVFERTVFHIDENYVDPSRLDWERMFGAVLTAIERQVPAAVFSREPGGSKVTVELGEYLTVLEIDPIEDHKGLIAATRQVAQLVAQHVDSKDLPEGDANVDRWQELEYAMVNGMLEGALDPHSNLLPPRAASDMDDENRGEFGGLGVTVSEREGWLTVEYTVEGSPADGVGLEKADKIIRIDGESTLNMTVDDAVTRLRGPQGAPVTLEIAREGRADFEVQIVRASIPLRPVRAELLDGGIGIVVIPGFHAEAEAQLQQKLALLKRKAGGELKGLILDLRGNPGGYYHEGWKVADTFIPEGRLVSTVDRDGQRVDSKDARSNGTEPMYPMAVLVDARSASASEIVAGALRNNDRAVIIGQRSFGKGSVQNLHEYVDGSKLKLTVSRYLTPGDRSIQAVGIPADIALNPAPYNAQGAPDRRISLHGEELDTREADLPGALDADALIAEQPAYSLSFLEPEGVDRSSEDWDPEADFEVRLARDVLMAAPSWRRAEVLASASRVVSRYARTSEQELVVAISALGLDWSQGPAVVRGGPLPVELTLEPATVQAGERTELVLKAKNVSDAPIFRTAVLVTEHDVLAGREFLFGKLDAGEERSWPITVTPPVGYPHERAPVVFSLRDGGPDPVGEARAELEILANEPADLEWEIAFADADGDGRAEVQERVELKLTVKNQGKGPAVGVVVRAQNRSGAALDLMQGNLAIGDPIDPEGQPCDPEVRGRDTRVCRSVLLAGQEWTGTIAVEIRDHPVEGSVGLDLRVEHRLDYDWAAIARGQLSEIYATTEHLTIPIAEPLPAAIHRRAPTIEITHRPDVVASGDRVTISGVVSDPSGLAHVMVLDGPDKVFHQGAGRKSTLKAIPFTADLELAPGLNTLVVEATDVDGMVSSASVVTWSRSAELASVSPER